MYCLGSELTGVPSVLTDFVRSNWDPALVGRRSTPYSFTVERGAVTKVAAAAEVLGLWLAGGEGEEAPLSYLWTMLNNTPDYRVYEDWVMQGLDPGSAHIHTGDDYFLYRPIRVGDRITVTCEISRVYEKPGRQGRLVFIEDTWEFRNDRNELAARLVRKAVTVYYENRDPNPRYQQVDAPASVPGALADIEPVVWSALKKGAVVYDVDLGPLSRPSMVRWMGAVDDYAATHYDPDYAVERDFPGHQPLAAGPHLGALLAAPVAHWIGDTGRIAEFRHLQRHEVFPKERLRTFGTVSREPTLGDPTVEVEGWLLDDRGMMRNAGTFVVEPT
jgi:hypothetical protein